MGNVTLWDHNLILFNDFLICRGRVPLVSTSSIRVACYNWATRTRRVIIPIIFIYKCKSAIKKKENNNDWWAELVGEVSKTTPTFFVWPLSWSRVGGGHYHPLERIKSPKSKGTKINLFGKNNKYWRPIAWVTRFFPFGFSFRQAHKWNDLLV